MTEQVKAKKKLSEITFEHTGAHIALVSKQQGGGAVGHNYALVMKALPFSPEYITKMQSVKVTLDTPEFLRRFFHLYDTDAEVLARLMGWVPEEVEGVENDWEKAHREYIEERLASFEIMKAAHEQGNLAFKDVNEKDYLRFLKDQSLVEKAFRKIEKESKKESAVKAAVGSTEAVTKSGKGEVEPSDKPQEKNKMEEQVQELQKAMQSQAEELQKALATVAAFEAEKKEAIIKAKTDKVTALVKDEKVAGALVKAALQLEAEDFDNFVQAVQTLSEQVEKSALFQEKGITADEQKPVENENKVAAVLKAKFAPK